MSLGNNAAVSGFGKFDKDPSPLLKARISIPCLRTTTTHIHSARMLALEDLPNDIQRLLFGFAASATRIAALSLSLVSKEVQSWRGSFFEIGSYVHLLYRTDPQLFRFLHCSARGWFQDSLVEGILVDLCSPTASPRLVRARDYVRVIACRNHMSDATQIGKWLATFPYLTQIALGSTMLPPHPDEPHFDFDQSYPYLKRIYLGNLGPHKHFLPPSIHIGGFVTPFWKTITHLQVCSESVACSAYSPFSSPLFSTMPNLTHLAVIVRRSSPEETPFALTRIRASFPPSLQLCILGMVDWSYHNPDFTTLDIFYQVVAGTFDHRLIWWPQEMNMAMTNSNGREAFALWCGMPDGKPTIWDLGEDTLKKRRSGQ
ncbi:hypothetical protein DL96DRAFT_1720560 [Flagelloscypha sp. PMI_526]|nr:hypothetical protein DL96DRAFT_1720560 [Flagelloscypha sp. PMI_526]